MDYAQKWHAKAKMCAEQGILDDMVSNELFDHTWMASIHQLEKHLKITDGHKLLDAGCGWGRLLFGLKYFHPGVMIDGYELTAQFVDRARKLVRQNNLQGGVRIIQGDLLQTDIPTEYYDSFYSCRVFHYIEKKELLIAKLYSSLKFGGRGIVILPNRNCPYQWLKYKHAPLYPIRSIGEMMKAVGFKKTYYGGYRFLPASIRFPHNSFVSAIEKCLGSTPLGKFGGLAYVVGEK